MFDIIKRYEKVKPSVLENYRKIEESASINECMAENGALEHDFRPVWPGTRIVGNAFTVKARPGDNLILHKAITMLKPDDVLVVSCDGFQESGGMWGGMMSMMASTQGAVGMIIDGCVRDTMAIKEAGFHIWSRGINIKKSTKKTEGQINIPVVIGGVYVRPGDVIFADNDAVVAIPREIAAQTAYKALEREEDEKKTLEKIKEDPCFVFKNKFRFAYEALNLKEEA